jgi:transcriptional regulator with XRE-family HTH domain
MTVSAPMRRHAGRSTALRFLLQAGIHREEIAEVLEVPATTISRWLNGKRRCHAGALAWTVLVLLDQDPVMIENTPTKALTKVEREAVITALKAVQYCEMAWKVEHPTSKLKPSR